MSDERNRQSPYHEFVRKVGTVTAAAAALLASSTADAKLQNTGRELFGRFSLLSANEVEERAKILPPPLVLKASSAPTLIAGHRSHSSHSSHRSHVSGSGHASHYSSTTGARTTRTTPSMAADRFDAGASNTKSSKPISPVKSEAANGLQPASGSIEKPEDRFQLINLPNVQEEVRAYIKDRSTGKSLLLSIGEEVGDYMLVEIDAPANTVRLRTGGNSDVTIKKLGVK